MNAEKTTAVWLSSNRNLVVKYMQHLGMEWNPPKFKVQGIWFTNDLDNSEKKKKKKKKKKYSEKFAEDGFQMIWTTVKERKEKKTRKSLCK